MYARLLRAPTSTRWYLAWQFATPASAEMASADTASEGGGEGVEETKRGDVDDARSVNFSNASNSSSNIHPFAEVISNPIHGEDSVDTVDGARGDHASAGKTHGIFKRIIKRRGYLRKQGLMVAQRPEAEKPSGTNFELVNERWRKFLWFRDPEVCAGGSKSGLCPFAHAGSSVLGNRLTVHSIRSPSDGEVLQKSHGEQAKQEKFEAHMADYEPDLHHRTGLHVRRVPALRRKEEGGELQHLPRLSLQHRVPGHSDFRLPILP
mmetsp:Transcript_98545/g.281733  ORF Transcript_98545/g.281733 Transcript_98545/m.281733 type:complete len:264 (-) Transcript_98545:231-1022(-)